MIHNASRDDVIWLAGLLEGEGNFDAHGGRYARVRLAMTDRDVVGRVASLIGSSLRLTLRDAPNAPTWHAEKQGEAAVAVMEAVLPFMGARRSAKIAQILAMHKLRGSDKYGLPYGESLPRPPGLASLRPRELEAV